MADCAEGGNVGRRTLMYLGSEGTKCLSKVDRNDHYNPVEDKKRATKE